ncbi:hypothetical protein Leryth_019106 [Lithospermum erythrorhizon]|nr:hypothetical protein Leryth_019106 [Lithospermum erythrorhizon]
MKKQWSQFHGRSPVPQQQQPQFPLQNPSFSNFPYNIPIQHPNFVNFPFQNPSQFNLVNIQSPPQQHPRELIEHANRVVLKARAEILASKQGVTVWKVSQAALMTLKANSWESLGISMHLLPSLHSLMVIEGKVNTFIHCFVAVRSICSLHDVEVALCKNEGVEQFEELELGPLVRHPLAVHYFCLSSDTTELYRITSEDIIKYLHAFVKTLQGTEVKFDEFLNYVAIKRRLTSKERLHVRIQDLGRHVTNLRQAEQLENTVLKKYIKGLRKDKVKIRPFLSQKKQMDDQFRVLTDRMKSFSSITSDSTGKHIRFETSSSGDEDDYDEDSDDESNSDYEDNNRMDEEQSHCKAMPLNSKHLDRVSTCPYPSVNEEITRLGLRNEVNLPVNCASSSQPSKRKRKSGSTSCSPINGDVSSSNLLQESVFLKKRARPTDLLGESIRIGEGKAKKSKLKKRLLSNYTKNKGLSVTNDSLRLFIATWKEACCQDDLEEVFDRMLIFYKNIKKNKVKALFSSYPYIGLLNVAIKSIKYGMWDTMYDSLPTLGQHGSVQTETRDSCLAIEDEEGAGNVPASVEKTFSQKCVVTSEDVIKKIAAYLDANSETMCNLSAHMDKRLGCFRMLGKCESWLSMQFQVDEFESLGFGEFLNFLEKNMQLLPDVFQKCMTWIAGEDVSLHVFIEPLQLDVLMSQASENMWKNRSISKEMISEVLRNQFPSISFKIEKSDSTVNFQKKLSNYNATCGCILFSAALLNLHYSGDISSQNENEIADATGLGYKTGILGSQTAKEAIAVLLGAPMLMDLEIWSHWDLLFAPSLGPLIEWLVNKVNNRDFLCLATKGGKIIRIDHLATVDLFLEVILRGSSFETAVQLLSLLALYGGEQNAPTSLLKSHIQKAFKVFVTNSIETETSDDTNILLQRKMSHNQYEHSAGSNLSSLPYRNCSRVNEVAPTMARFILDCLSYLPPECCSFAAKLFLAGLQHFVKDASHAILAECRVMQERLILHEVGMELGVVEWINDYKKFCVAEDPHSLISSKSYLFSSSLESENDSNFVCKISNKNPSEDKVIFSKEADQDEKGFGQTNGPICLPDNSSSVPLGNPDLHISTPDTYGDTVRVIETIRKEEFGLDPSLSDAESSMLRKQHARLGRALHCLSQELYSQDSHFLLELVQNADDNVYPESVEPTLTFILLKKGIIVLNNEQGFCPENIKALCDVGNSTKKGQSTGYIGKKGIGFKSVFRITNAPEIHSNGFHIKFDISEGQIGFVLPTAISPCDMDFYSRLVSSDTNHMDENYWKTCIVLPFNSNLSGGVALNNITSMFSDLHPSLLLFLHRIKCINFRNMLNNSFVIMRKEVVGDGLVKVFLGEQKMTWLVVSHKLQADTIRSDVQTTEISIAFTLDETDEGQYIPHLEQQPVFAYLPLRTYGLKFILQGDFVLPSSREEVDGDSPWNQWLLSEFPSLLIDAQRSFCNLPCFKKSLGKAVSAFMSFLPLAGEVHGFFSTLPRMIITKLRVSNCLLLDDNLHEWVPPCKVIRNWTEQARALLPDKLVHEHLGLGFIHKDIILSDSIAKSLGVEEYGPKLLLQILSSLCRSEDGLRSMGLGWLSAWLSAFYGLTSSSGIGSDLTSPLRKLPFIPLLDGTYGSLDDGIIWLNSDALSPGVNHEYDGEAFPTLYSQLRIVCPALYSADAATDISSINGSVTQNVTRMLLRAGVQRISGHDIVKDHILPALSDEINALEKKDLAIDYLAFSMFHLNSSCAHCRHDRDYIIAELRRKALILTNHGIKRPAKTPIHFSKDFGNKCDMKKLTNGLDLVWHEVDKTYLEHPITKFVSGGMPEWRTFLQELGVTDFVQIFQVEKCITDVPNNIQRSIMGDQGLMSTDLIVRDWESEECKHLLSQLSIRSDKEKSRYLLEVLDVLWDDCFGNKVNGCCLIPLSGESKKFRSSLGSMLNEVRWMTSSVDDELHYPRDLFHDCEAVRSVVGNFAPYSVPKVENSNLLKDIGLKTQVALDDMLSILKVWRKSKTPFKASISQMTKFYDSIWSEMATSKQKVMEELLSEPFIFVPYVCDSHEEVVPGEFLSPEDVYWHDSTGSMDVSAVTSHNCLQNASHHPSSKILGHVYPRLQGFFVNECGVHEAPPLRSYLPALLKLSTVSLPSQSAKTVFKIFLKWADGLKSGSLTSEEVEYLKESLMKKEFSVLPTVLDNWVSLNPIYGLICWSSDQKLKKEFKHHDDIDFLYFGELNDEEKEMYDTKFPLLMQRLGIPSLSQVVTREAIYYGHADNSFKVSLVNWVLPYAQRYICSVHPDKYLQLKQTGLLNMEVQIFVVEKLFYKNVIKKFELSSKKRYECSSLLQGSILYTTQESDSHSIFLELSRLFFEEPELHLANFLHMITTMVESGSTEEQTEFFILTAEVPRRISYEAVWTLTQS